MKKIISLLISAGMLFGIAFGVTAADNSPAVYLNGEQMTFDTEPYIENGRTLVPMRAIFEGIGAEVTWDGETQSVFGVRETAGGELLLVSLQIGSLTAFAGSQTVTLDTAAVIKDDTTYVPLRFVSETLGADVEWDADNYAVIITVE